MAAKLGDAATKEDECEVFLKENKQMERIQHFKEQQRKILKFRNVNWNDYRQRERRKGSLGQVGGLQPGGSMGN